MLKNLDPLLNADVLYALRAMGHGDELVISDTNFPSASVASHTVLGRLLRIDAPAARVVEAVLSVMPLDSFVEHPAKRMENSFEPEVLPPVQQEVQKAIDRTNGEPSPLGSIERFAFYEHARTCYCVIATQELRGWGCFILKKGVILPA